MPSVAISAPDFFTSSSGKTPYLPAAMWAVECLVALEDKAKLPLLSRLAVASSIRRSTAYAALAAIKLDMTAQTAVAELSPGELVDWLLTADPGHLIEVTFGETEGLQGVLAKTIEPLRDPAHYLWIAATMRGTTDRARKQATCLRHAKHITSDLCDVLSIVRSRLIRPGIVSGINSPKRARHVEALVSHIAKVAPSVPPNVISQSLETGGLADLFRWASRMVLRHGVGLDGGLEDCADFTVLRSGEDYKRAAVIFQNCIADETQGRALAASFSIATIAEWRHDRVLAVLTLISDGGDDPVWMCERLWGPCNSKVPDGVARAVTKALRKRGILTVAHTTPKDASAELVEAYCDREDFYCLRSHQVPG